MSQIENPRFSARIDQIRLRRAILLPDFAQKAASSGSQRSIHFDSTASVMLVSLLVANGSAVCKNRVGLGKGHRTRRGTPQLSFRLDVVGPVRSQRTLCESRTPGECRRSRRFWVRLFALILRLPLLSPCLRFAG